jgi:DEAD/DEAH box helicase domain-containing protein
VLRRRRLPRGGGLAALRLGGLFAIVDVSSGELLGSTEAARAFSTVHEGASTCTRGAPTRSESSTSSARRALVEPFDGDWYTQPKSETDTEIVRLLDRRETLGVTLSFGEVSVTDTVLAYQRRRLSTTRRSTCRARFAATSFSTQALWFELDAGELAARDGAAGGCCSARCTPPSTRRSRCCR